MNLVLIIVLAACTTPLTAMPGETDQPTTIM